MNFSRCWISRLPAWAGFGLISCHLTHDTIHRTRPIPTTPSRNYPNYPQRQQSRPVLVVADIFAQACNAFMHRQRAHPFQELASPLLHPHFPQLLFMLSSLMSCSHATLLLCCRAVSGPVVSEGAFMCISRCASDHHRLTATQHAPCTSTLAAAS